MNDETLNDNDHNSKSKMTKHDKPAKDRLIQSSSFGRIPVKFFIEPTYTTSTRSGEIIVQVADGLKTEKKGLCWQSSPQGRTREFRRRYYKAQQALVSGIHADRELINGHCKGVSTQDDGVGTIRKVFMVANSIVTICDALAFFLSPTHPSILVPAIFFAFDTLRKGEASGRSPAIQSLLSLFLGVVLTCCMISSVALLIYSPSLWITKNVFSGYSVFILAFSTLIYLILLNIFFNFGSRKIGLVPQCAVNALMQFVCCVSLIGARQPSFGTWSDIGACILLSATATVSWFTSHCPGKEDEFNMSAYTARMGSIALEHDRRIEAVRQLDIEPVNDRLLVEVGVTFGSRCPADEVLRSTSELRKKYLKLNYVHKAFVACC